MALPPEPHPEPSLQPPARPSLQSSQNRAWGGLWQKEYESHQQSLWRSLMEVMEQLKSWEGLRSQSELVPTPFLLLRRGLFIFPSALHLRARKPTPPCPTQVAPSSSPPHWLTHFQRCGTFYLSKQPLLLWLLSILALRSNVFL